MPQRTARRLGLLTLVLFVFSLAAAGQADEVATTEPAELPGPFLQSATADQQVSFVLSAVVQATTPSGLSTSAARISSEAVRATFWRPAAPPRTRTIVVQEGQSLWDISSAWGISIATIAAQNGLTNVNLVKPGQQLLIPMASDPDAPAKLAARAAKAVVTTPPKAAPTPVRTQGRAPRGAPRTQARTGGVKPLAVTLGEGQTLWSLARAHRVSVEAIVEANGLSDANRVRAGRRLVIPGRTAASQPARATTSGVRALRSGAAFTGAVSTAAVRIARGFLWPARGRLTSRFGWRRWRHHDGIDIAAPYGSPVYAARPGRVVFAGWYYAYGRAVIVDHGGGVQTLYGHASKLLVGAGETVGQGQLIARVGTSGRSTGPHVHFEVRVSGRPVNPILYMD